MCVCACACVWCVVCGVGVTRRRSQPGRDSGTRSATVAARLGWWCVCVVVCACACACVCARRRVAARTRLRESDGGRKDPPPRRAEKGCPDDGGARNGRETTTLAVRVDDAGAPGEETTDALLPPHCNVGSGVVGRRRRRAARASPVVGSGGAQRDWTPWMQFAPQSYLEREEREEIRCVFVSYESAALDATTRNGRNATSRGAAARVVVVVARTHSARPSRATALRGDSRAVSSGCFSSHVSRPMRSSTRACGEGGSSSSGSSSGVVGAVGVVFGGGLRR